MLVNVNLQCFSHSHMLIYKGTELELASESADHSSESADSTESVVHSCWQLINN